MLHASIREKASVSTMKLAAPSGYIIKLFGSSRSIIILVEGLSSSLVGAMISFISTGRIDLYRYMFLKKQSVKMTASFLYKIF